MITTVFFDWGGVIATDPGDDFLENLLRGVGASDDQLSDIFRNYMSKLTRGSVETEEFWQLLRDDYGFDIPDGIEEEFKKWKGLVADKNVLGLVALLRQKGLRVAVLSNVIKPSYQIIKDAGYYDLFDDAILSCEEGYRKPELALYHIALERMGVKPEEALFIDDKQVFLDPAIELGVHTVLARSPMQIVRDVSALVLK